jgi:hypothetical protein
MCDEDELVCDVGECTVDVCEDDELDVVEWLAVGCVEFWAPKWDAGPEPNPLKKPELLLDRLELLELQLFERP